MSASLDMLPDPMVERIIKDYEEEQAVDHYHEDNRGIFHACYHTCRGLLTNWQFWAGLTLGFPVEHALWEKLPPFSYLSHWLGL